ncbi:ATP synthase F0 subunit 8 (mitochondrion) [Alligator mississippiensis]|uniref:ATP synthase F(0) complex subunit 8 n=1 Tax=Alligator mississippiensis TaxID=8496 RepID=ATP8_ALLMI|nr:ATP synthase F0 subunit 8 [Alligator mississippiensis]O47871.1 RecName: Full=ATP synthase protein 8; AltName: Full=A6L; AltName: Full=F-ATPase subunit 8 [Alligator mississippiensis]AAD09984.1 ATPase 8 [Alligator mississippiensis]CAA73565.1 ATP synthase subunit 8 [Alligator mississippiensis]
MPQLNPEPWLTTFLIVWISLIVILQPKIASLMLTSSPTPYKAMTIKTWPWPWT